MATIVNVQEAKTQLSQLLARVEAGEVVIIARAGKQVAHLVPVVAVPDRTFGVLELAVPATFFDPLAEDEIAAWE